MKPFLKWAGSKQKIVHRITTLLPRGRRLVEPFCGSCAVFLNTEFEEYLLSDINRDLITLYQVLQREGTAFIEFARELFVETNNEADVYYELRRVFNTTNDEIYKSALFLYLNRHGYNGLCRYNNAGEFNVPFGRYRRPYFPYNEMVEFAVKARRATFVHRDFQQVMMESLEDDVIYADPPYVPLSTTARFTSYSAGGFTEAQQRILAQIAMEVSTRGVPVLISNHLCEFTESAYEGAELHTFEVRRYISRDGANRNMAQELLALFRA